MFLSDLSIKRPVFAAVLMLSLVTLGIFSFKRLTLDLYPNVEFPLVIVTTKFPGASPESVEREVTKRIEEAVNPIAGVKRVMSSSLEGVSMVIVEFQLHIKVNEATQEAQAKISAIRGELPEAIEEPVLQKMDFSAMPIVSLAVRSDKLNPKDLSTLVEKKIKTRLENISGVGKVDLVGLNKREVRVEVDPLALQSLGMGVDEVIAGLSGENVNTPLGRMKDGKDEASLRVSGKPVEAEGFAAMVVASREGRPVELGRVAKVTDGIEEQRTMSFMNGVPGIGLNIQKQSGANTVEIVDNVNKVLKKLDAELGEEARIEVVRDASVFIRDSVEDVENSMIIGGVLTIFIVFCFLNSWRSTVITGLTLPISVISSFIVMNFMGMSLNVMTLMALSLAIGLLIDDAIVVRENIVRHLEKGKDHFTAAREGTAEIGLAVLATSLSIVAVFVPVAFMKGIVGRFFFDFGITVAFAVLVSLFVSFTLDPMLSSRWVDPDIERTGKRGIITRLLDVFNDWFDKTADLYKIIIGWALDHRKTMVVCAVAAFVGGIMVFGSLESSFMPGYDRGEFTVNFKTAPDASIDETKDRVDKVVALIHSQPEVELSFCTVGANNTTVRDASIYVKLKDKSKRERGDEAVRKAIRAGLNDIPGIVPSIIEADSFNGQKALQVNLRGTEIAKLKEYAAALKEEIYKIPGVVDLEVTMEHDIPEYKFMVDRARAADSGLNTQSLVRTVGALVGGQTVTTYEDHDGDMVNVNLRLPEERRASVDDVLNLRILTPAAPGRAAGLVPLGDFVSYRVDKSPTQIDRQDLTRQVVISANLDGLALGTAVEKIKEAADKVPMEPGYRVVFSGEAEDMAESFGYMAESLLLAIIFVYLILAAQFESFIDPLSIMLSLPLSLVGMAGALKLTGDTISIMSLIGLIMLMGLVTKNAILLVDYAKILIREEGHQKREALIIAGRTRLRPIIMTTLAMIFGMLPTALALGAGAEMRAPMARAVIGGLITSTMLTLLVVPVVYSTFDDLGNWIKRKWTGNKPVHAALAAMLVLTASVARAEAPRMLTLAQVQELAATKNHGVQKASEQKNRYDGKYVEERSAIYPRLTATANTIRSEDQSQDEISPQPNPGVTVSTVDLNVRQTLYTFGQVEAAIRAAEVGLKIGDDEIRAARKSAVNDATRAYWDVLLARELNALATEALKQKERHLDEAQKKFASGVATDYDVLSAQVAVKNARPEVIRSANQVRLALDNLRNILGLGAEEIDVAGELSVAASSVPTYDKALETAYKTRPELAALTNTLGVYEELVTIAEAGTKPRLDFAGNVGYRYNDPDGSAEGDGIEWSAGIFASWPFFDGGATKGRVTQAQSSAQTARVSLRELKDAIALGVRSSTNLVREAEEVMLALEGTVEEAQRLVEMAEKGYEYGVKNKLDVDDANLNLTLAKTNRAKARRDYLVARAALDYVTGVIGD